MTRGTEIHSESGKSSVSTTQNELSQSSNEQLLIAVANYRDRAAFEQLFERFAKRVFGLGIKLARNEQISRDLVQEVMLTVWQNAAAFDMDRGSAQSWIFSMARNKCIDILRKLNRSPIAVTADDVWTEYQPDSELIEAANSANEALASGADIERIKRLSERLPAPQRRAIELVYVQDQTHEEASTELKIPLGTFKSRLRLGLIKLRKNLGTDLGEIQGNEHE